MDDPTETTRPQSVAEIFFAFNRLALQGFGGVLAVAQRELVERLRWMTREQYLETLAMVGIKMDAFTRQKQVAVARRETQRLERLIGDLLDTTRLEAGGGHFERCEIRISELFERVVEHHEPESRTRGTQCRQSVSPLAQEWRSAAPVGPADGAVC